MKVTCWTVLGFIGNIDHITEADVKKRYRELLKKNHPDAGGSTEMMQLITEAYQEALEQLKSPGTSQEEQDRQAQEQQRRQAQANYERQRQEQARQQARQQANYERQRQEQARQQQEYEKWYNYYMNLQANVKQYHEVELEELVHFLGYIIDEYKYVDGTIITKESLAKDDVYVIIRCRICIYNKFNREEKALMIADKFQYDSTCNKCTINAIINPDDIVKGKCKLKVELLRKNGMPMIVSKNNERNNDKVSISIGNSASKTLRYGNLNVIVNLSYCNEN